MVRLVQNSFFGGQLDFEMMGRQDYQRYAKGATKLCNFNVMKRGGLDKRRGFDRVMNLVETLGSYGVTADEKFRAIPFAYQKSHGFVLLMSEHKCIMVSTIPESVVGYYEISGLDGVYTASEIDEIDYQQCGDTLFLAHQNHKPAKIEHVIDFSGHGFHYSVIDLESRKVGIPAISNAQMKRIAVKGNSSAGLVTEEYKVSAVFNGIETLPCDTYKNPNAGTGSGSGDDYTDVSNRATTQYRAPWTESQTITLTIDINKGSDDDGNEVYPEKICVYKKAFNYFGLIGVIDKSSGIGTLINSLVAKSTENTSMTFDSYQNTGGAATNNVLLTTAEAVGGITKYSDGLKQFYWPNTYSSSDGKYTNNEVVFDVSGFTDSTWVKGMQMFRLWVGGVYYTVNTEEGQVVSVTFTYTGFPKCRIGVATAKSTGYGANLRYVQVGSYVYHELVNEPSVTYTVAKESGETDEEFVARWTPMYESFASSLHSTRYIDITLDNGNSKLFMMKVVNETGSAVFDRRLVVGGIATYSISSQVTFVDNYITPDSSITPIEDFEDGMMSSEGNYPASVSLSQQRLIWASSKNDPQRIWMSAIGDFYSYHTHEIMTPDDAIDFQLPVTRFGKINHICEMRKLLLFNSACEWLVDSVSSVQGLTYETIQAYPQSYSGSSERLKPIICNNSLIFCERTGQTVRRFAYDISNDGFAGRDVSILSSSIFEFNSIIDWTYQQFPYSTLWCAMMDGTMASFEYMEEQDIMAWLTHKLGGGGKVMCIATSYAVSPALDDIENVDEYEYATHEEIFAVVKRQGSLWLERMRPRTKTPTDNMSPCVDTLYHSLCLDGLRVLNSTNGFSPTDEEGAVWIPANTTDGTPITSKEEAEAVLAGGVELYEGFPFDAVYTSVYPNISNGIVGNGQFDIKHVQGCGLRLMHSFGGKVTPVGADLSEPIQYFYNDPQNDHRAQFYTEEVTVDGVTVERSYVKLFNHNTHLMTLPGVNNRDGRVTISQDDPYPFSILSYEIDFEPETGGYRQ